MLKIHITFLGILLIVSCSSEKGNSDSNYSNGDSLVENIDAVESDMDTTIIKARQEYEIIMTKKSYLFKCTKNCSSSAEPPDGNPDTLKKYGKGKPYNIIKSHNDSIYVIQFKFTDDCCQEFVGDIDIVSNQLKLTYKDISGRRCDCDCEYGYRFEINLKNRKMKKIYINGNKI
jgi:hypothetical protein